MGDGVRGLRLFVLHVWADELVWNISSILLAKPAEGHVAFGYLVDWLFTALHVLLLSE